MSEAASVFTLTSALSLLGVLAAGISAYVASNALLPKNASKTERVTFVWLAFDGLIHFTYEGSFLYLSTFGRTANSSVGPLAELWKEYSRADFRWGWADPTVVSLELLTVLGVAPMCWYVVMQLIQRDPARHYWIVILCTSELYGGWMTFCPEWLTGSSNLNTSNPFHFWVYLVFMNIIWVIIPVWLMIDSYQQIVGSLRAKAKKD